MLLEIANEPYNYYFLLSHLPNYSIKYCRKRREKLVEVENHEAFILLRFN